VGDIEPPRTGTTVTKRSDTVTVMTAAVTNFLVQFHTKLLEPMCMVYIYVKHPQSSASFPQHNNKRATESETN